VAEALTAPDPVEAFRRVAEGPGLDEDVRAALRAADERGIRIAALLVARLRFERLIRGSEEADRWFEEDPKGFTESFRRYHHAVPPTAFSPPAEAALFRRWRATGGRDPGG
jgi:hypothetical protein